MGAIVLQFLRGGVAAPLIKQGVDAIIGISTKLLRYIDLFLLSSMSSPSHGDHAAACREGFDQCACEDGSCTLGEPGAFLCSSKVCLQGFCVRLFTVHQRPGC